MPNPSPSVWDLLQVAVPERNVYKIEVGSPPVLSTHTQQLFSRGRWRRGTVASQTRTCSFSTWHGSTGINLLQPSSHSTHTHTHTVTHKRQPQRKNPILKITPFLYNLKEGGCNQGLLCIDTQFGSGGVRVERVQLWSGGGPCSSSFLMVTQRR